MKTRVEPSNHAVVDHLVGWRLKWTGAVVLLLAATGCAGQSKYVPENRADFAPEPGRALVVFMCPSGFGVAIQSSVFDITDGAPEFIGIVSAKTKFAHNTAPGEHRYMVIGESADFLDAELLADRTCCSLVTPRVEVWKARFSLKPMHKFDPTSTKFTKRYDYTRRLDNTSSSQSWA